MSRSQRGATALLRRGAQVAAVVVLVVGVAVLSVRGFDRDTSGVESGRTPDTAQALSSGEPFFTSKPTLLVVTDSIGGGADPTITRNYPQALAEKFNWNLVLDAMSARGFLATDLSSIGADTAPPVLDNLEYDAANFKADYIIVDTGRNDLGKAPADVLAAAQVYLTQLRAAYPQARMFLMLPAYISPVLIPTFPTLAEGLRASAASVDATVFDPIDEGWYTDVDLTPWLYKDGIHLNGEGAEYYAERVAEDMRRAGVTPWVQPEEGEQ